MTNVDSSEGTGWLSHDGGSCPTDAERKVIVRYRNGVVSPEIEAGMRRWESWADEIGESDWDIVAWMLVSKP